MAQALSEPLGAAAAYRTFSPRLAPALTVAGSVFAVVGGLGVWVRAIEVTPAGAPIRVASITGAGRAWGWIIAIVAVVAGAAASQWSSSRLARVSAPLVASVAAVVLIAFRLDWAGDVAGSLAFKAGLQAGRSFTTYHAGFGWGAWLLALAAVAFVLGVVAGVLRAIDVKRGMPS